MSTYFLENEFSNEKNLAIGEYEKCQFKNCDFSERSLSQFRFIDCEFDNCNLSMCALSGTLLQKVNFIDCKLLGLRFDSCNEFSLSLSFEKCVLNHSSFYQLKLRDTKFSQCQLVECDFAETDLNGSIFTNSNLKGAIFDRTNLEKSDLSTAFNFIINPENNHIKSAKFSIAGLAGLLSNHQIIIVP